MISAAKPLGKGYASFTRTFDIDSGYFLNDSMIRTYCLATAFGSVLYLAACCKFESLKCLSGPGSSLHHSICARY